MTIAWLLYVLLVGALLCAGAAALSSAAIALRRPSRGRVGRGARRHRGARRRSRPSRQLARGRATSRANRSRRRRLLARRDADACGRRRACARGTSLGDASTSLIGSLDRRVPRARRACRCSVAWATASALLLALFALVNARARQAAPPLAAASLHGVTAACRSGDGTRRPRARCARRSSSRARCSSEATTSSVSSSRTSASTARARSPAARPRRGSSSSRCPGIQPSGTSSGGCAWPSSSIATLACFAPAPRRGRTARCSSNGGTRAEEAASARSRWRTAHHIWNGGSWR